MSTRGDDAPPPNGESTPVTEGLERENERLRDGLRRAERDRARLRRKIERLQGQLDAARRDGFRQAAPFSRGTPTRRPRGPGRKPGAAYGRRACRATPTRVAAQTQMDLPPIRPVVRACAVHIGRCQPCHRRVQGRHPLQTSEALGAAAVQVGPAVVALSAQYAGAGVAQDRAAGAADLCRALCHGARASGGRP